MGSQARANSIQLYHGEDYGKPSIRILMLCLTELNTMSGPDGIRNQGGAGPNQPILAELRRLKRAFGHFNLDFVARFHSVFVAEILWNRNQATWRIMVIGNRYISPGFLNSLRRGLRLNKRILDRGRPRPRPGW
jgi:hypothetical protein